MPREQNHAGQAAPKSLSSRGLLAKCEALCPTSEVLSGLAGEGRS